LTLLASALERAARDLGELRASYALIGGLAVSVRCEPRFTRDLDLAVAVTSDVEAEALVHALVRRGYRLLAQLEQEATKRLATVRLRPPGEVGEKGVVIDLLFASSGLEPDIVAAAETLEVFPHLSVPVASIAHLVATKVLARDDRTRPQDLADLRGLLARADGAELGRARAALESIRARGYHRGRDLMAALDELLSP